MSFDELVNVKMPEVEIFDRFVEIMQKNFHKYQDVCVLLPLGAADGHSCSVEEVRIYKVDDESDTIKRREYIFSGEYEKTYLISKFDHGYQHHHTALFGHFHFKIADTYLEKTIIPIDSVSENDCVTQKRLPRELLEGAFGEIKAALSKKKSA